MGEIANIILVSGKAGIELALFVLLPFMIVMLTFMRILEAKGILNWIVEKISPIHGTPLAKMLLIEAGLHLHILILYVPLKLTTL